jgi:hypothetical protein
MINFWAGTGFESLELRTYRYLPAEGGVPDYRYHLVAISFYTFFQESSVSGHIFCEACFSRPEMTHCPECRISIGEKTNFRPEIARYSQALIQL